MKTKTKDTCLAVLLAMLCTPSARVLAQGDLIPPGPPEPSMKSLVQIEPRVPISEPMVIESPGSYYLINPIVVDGGNAITIVADGVTLDLNGFTIRSVAAPAGGRGIYLDGDRRNITIRNGFIEGGVTNNGSGVYGGTGFGAGIYSDDTTDAMNIIVRNVSVAGCQNNGIRLGASGSGKSTVVESCTVRTAGDYGIFASSIINCIATDCGNHAISGDLVSDCHGESMTGNGISAYTARNCYGESVSGQGVGTSVAIGCFGYSLSGVGLYAHIANSCVGATAIGIDAVVTHKYNMP